MLKNGSRPPVWAITSLLLISFAVTPASASDCVSDREQVVSVRSNNVPVFGARRSIVEAALAFDCADAEDHHTAQVRDSA